MSTNRKIKVSVLIFSSTIQKLRNILNVNFENLHVYSLQLFDNRFLLLLL